MSVVPTLALTGMSVVPTLALTGMSVVSTLALTGTCAGVIAAQQSEIQSGMLHLDKPRLRKVATAGPKQTLLNPIHATNGS